MLKLKSSSPGATTLRHLAGKQADINGQPAGRQVARAQTLWNAKSNAQAGKAAFGEIRKLLLGLCVGTELCNYCEYNEASDIEHIYPKSFFPERTFQWSNYLLACKACNTQYKLDQFAVFAPAQSANAVAVQRGQPLPSLDVAFIDPRVEDPMHYLFLDITEKSFLLIPHPALTDPRAIAKARHTLAILQIGRRAALADAREKALSSYQHWLGNYRQVRDATTWDDLEYLVQDPHWLNKSNSFAAERQSMLDNLKETILTHQHRTVWREMQRQHQRLRKTKLLFEAVPEALTWI